MQLVSFAGFINEVQHMVTNQRGLFAVWSPKLSRVWISSWQCNIYALDCEVQLSDSFKTVIEGYCWVRWKPRYLWNEQFLSYQLISCMKLNSYLSKIALPGHSSTWVPDWKLLGLLSKGLILCSLPICLISTRSMKAISETKKKNHAFTGWQELERLLLSFNVQILCTVLGQRSIAGNPALSPPD